MLDIHQLSRARNVKERTIFVIRAFATSGGHSGSSLVPSAPRGTSRQHKRQHCCGPKGDIPDKRAVAKGPEQQHMVLFPWQRHFQKAPGGASQNWSLISSFFVRKGDDDKEDRADGSSNTNQTHASQPIIEHPKESRAILSNRTQRPAKNGISDATSKLVCIETHRTAPERRHPFAL